MAPPAPPPQLQTVLDFVNTRDVESGNDEFPDPATLAMWLRDRGLLEPGAPATPDDLQLAVDVREELRAALFRHAGDTGGSGADTRAFRTAATIPLTLALDSDGVPALTSAGKGVVGALGRLLAAIPGGVADGSWDRVKVCLAETCQWAFYDESRNRSRRWCSMAVCGNREKTRAFRGKASTGDGD